MNAEELRAIQAPLKQTYREHPETARNIARAEAIVEPYDIACTIRAWHGEVTAGLHQSAGGSGELACSADMLLEALVACAGVTLRAVATALNITLRGGTVRAEGDLDFRGTLGVDKAALVGFKAIRLGFDLDTDAGVEELKTLLKLTERYCVIYQTLTTPPQIAVTLDAAISKTEGEPAYASL